MQAFSIRKTFMQLHAVVNRKVKFAFSTVIVVNGTETVQITPLRRTLASSL